MILSYEAKNAEIHKKVGGKLWDLEPNKHGYVLKIEVNFPIRSNEQNKRYHSIMKLIATQTGQDKDDVEREFKLACHYKAVKTDSGFEIRFPLSSKKNLDGSDATTRDFTALMIKLENWCAEVHPEITILRKGDLDYKRWMEIDENYKKTFSGM